MAEQNPNPETKEKSPPIIKVFGVGGGGSNAVNYMKSKGIIDVDFFVCNTDAQALENSPVDNKIPIGQSLTEGRGAGNNPDVGRNAAIESENDIAEILSKDTKMLFVTAGMGGGTGTGAAPVIAATAQKLGILTIGIVTIPFKFEGQTRLKQAIAGLEEMEKHVDSLLVIDNEKLRKIHGDLKISEAFIQADEVLLVAAKGIAEIITVHGHVNVDFADVRTVMKESGVAIMGSACASGSNRGLLAIKKALSSPLLNSDNIKGARNVLLNVTSGVEEFRLDELGEITDYVQSAVQDDVQIIWGNGTDASLGEKIRIVIIATGFMKHDVHEAFAFKKKVEQKQVMELKDEAPEIRIKEQPAKTAPVVEPPKEEESNPPETPTRVELNDEVKEKILKLAPPPMPKKTVAEERKEIYEKKPKNQAKKKQKKSVKMGEWFQTTLDNLFNEDVE